MLCVAHGIKAASRLALDGGPVMQVAKIWRQLGHLNPWALTGQEYQTRHSRADRVRWVRHVEGGAMHFTIFAIGWALALLLAAVALA